MDLASPMSAFDPTRTWAQRRIPSRTIRLSVMCSLEMLAVVCLLKTTEGTGREGGKRVFNSREGEMATLPPSSISNAALAAFTNPKARRPRSIPYPLPVRPKGRTPDRGSMFNADSHD